MPQRFQVYLGGQYSNEKQPGRSTLPGGWAPADWLEVSHLSHGANGEIGEARINAHKHPEDARAVVRIHQAVQVRDALNAGSIVFSGVAVKYRTVIGGEDEQFQLVCYGNGDDILFRDCLHGQQRRNTDEEQSYYDAGMQQAAKGVDPTKDLVLIDTPMVFNPEGEPNATDQIYYLSKGVNAKTSTFRLFECPGRMQANQDKTDIKAVPWTLSHAVRYVLNFCQAQWAIDPSSWTDSSLVEMIKQNADPVISNINVEGKSPLEALRALCEPHNYVFSCDPYLLPGQGKHRLRFYLRGDGPAAPVLLSPRGTPSAFGRSNVINIDITEDTTSCINYVEAYGDRIEYTTLAHTKPPDTTIPVLQPAWEESELKLAFDEGIIINTIDTTFRQFFCSPPLISPTGIYGTGRCWRVNLGEIPTVQLEPLDTDTNNDNNSVDLRRFERPNIYEKNGTGGQLQQADIQVEMSFDNGTNWDTVEKNWYRVMTDGMGIVFTDPRLERLGIKFKNNDVSSGKTYWQALSEKKLQIRVLCAIKSDARVNAVVLNGGTSCPLATKRIYDNPGYRKFVQNSNVPSATFYTNFKPLTPDIDDSEHLRDMTKIQVATTDRVMVSGTIAVVMGNVGDYVPGNTVTGITGRNLTFTSPATILRVVYDLQALHVHLTLDNQKVPTLLKARPVEERSRREFKLGIENLVPIQGAVQEDYRGNIGSPDYQRYLREQAEK